MSEKHRDSTRAWNKEKQALRNMTTSMPSKETKNENEKKANH